MTLLKQVILSRPALALALAVFLNCPAQAQTKIAIIDLRKVFDGYWKTKQADAQLKDRAGDLDKARKGMVEDYQKANDEYKKLIEGASDQLLSNDEREKRKAAAEKKLLEIKEIEQSVSAFDRTSRTTLSEQQRRMREKLLGEIREKIDTRAKAQGYTLVLDSSAESFNNQTTIFLYIDSQNDLTQSILTELNATAPAGALTADPDKPKSDAPKEKDDKK
jgi:outer membrane protein